MNESELRRLAQGVTYPANQEYDPVTLTPLGITKQRVSMMEHNLPELLNGGESLLDLGSNKGFVSFLCRDAYKTIHGYEMGTHAHAISEAVRKHHDLENIAFFHKSFRQVPIGKVTTLCEGHGPYDVVYVGSVHHHFFKDAIRHDAPPWLPFKKLIALAREYIILDGPLSFTNDTSLPKWEQQYGWPADVRESYTLENHARWLSPQFALVRDPVPNERGRHSAVFKRVAPNIERREMSSEDIARVQQTGTPIRANTARESGSVMRVGSVRYKFDRGVQTDGVLMVLNSLPDWFAETQWIMTSGGVPIGDVTAWIDGTSLIDIRDIARSWLRMNDLLACIGLIEIHVKIGDFIHTPDGHWIDVDVDMVNDVDRIAEAYQYLTKWKKGAKRAFGPLTSWIADNLAAEFVFRDALARLEE